MRLYQADAVNPGARAGASIGNLWRSCGSGWPVPLRLKPSVAFIEKPALFPLRALIWETHLRLHHSRCRSLKKPKAEQKKEVKGR